MSSSKETAAHTPMMQQVSRIKAQNPDSAAVLSHGRFL